MLSSRGHFSARSSPASPSPPPRSRAWRARPGSRRRPARRAQRRARRRRAGRAARASARRALARPDARGRRRPVPRCLATRSRGIRDLALALLSPQAQIDRRRGVGRPPPAPRPARLARADRARRLRRRRLDRQLARRPRRRRERDRPRAARPAGRVQGRDEFARLGIAFNEMADQLEAARRQELGAERARLRDATVRFGEALAATPRRRPAPARDRRDRRSRRPARPAGSSSASAARSSRPARSPTAGERFELPLTAGRQSFGTLTLAGRGLHGRPAAHGRRRSSPTRRSRSRTPACTGSSPRQALVDMLTGLANRRHCEEALASELLARRALRRLRLPSCSPTSTASSRSTTATGTRSATACWSSSPRRSASACARSTSPPAGAARSSRSSCPGTDLEGAAHLAERARTALEERTILAPDGTRIYVTVSLGVAAFPEAADADNLVASADGALYEAKRAGRTASSRRGRRATAQRLISDSARVA